MRWLTNRFAGNRTPSCKPCECLNCQGTGYIEIPTEGEEDEPMSVTCIRCGGSGSVNTLNDKYFNAIEYVKKHKGYKLETKSAKAAKASKKLAGKNSL
jgi:DnaJ-class molecular chaperone